MIADRPLADAPNFCGASPSLPVRHVVAEYEAAQPRDDGDGAKNAQHEDRSVTLERVALLRARRVRQPVVANLEHFASDEQDDTDDGNGDLENEHVLNHPAR